MKQFVPLPDGNVATAMPVRNLLLIFSGGFGADA
jgi:hypothetical protein